MIRRELEINWKTGQMYAVEIGGSRLFVQYVRPEEIPPLISFELSYDEREGEERIIEIISEKIREILKQKAKHRNGDENG